MPLYATNPQTGERVQFNGREWVPAPPEPPVLGDQGGSPQQVMGGPIIAGMASLMQRAGTAGARVGNMLSPGQPFTAPQEDPRLAQTYPTATAIGQAAPYAIPVPGGFLANTAAGAAIGALTEPDPTKGALLGGASSAAGYGAGSILGRVLSGIGAASKKTSRALASGIQQTTGEALGNRRLMGLEESMARNAVTGGPFMRQADANRRIIAGKVLRFLGQEGDTLTEGAVGKAWRESVDNIRNAVPDGALIPVPEEAQAAIKRFNALPDEIVSIPEGAAMTGKDFRNARSDILKLTKSPKATVRDKARATLELMDNAAQESGTIDPEMYALGRKQYRMWKTLTARGVTKPGTASGTLEINPGALDETLGRQFGAQSTKGGVTTGNQQVDDLIAAVRDFRRTRDFGAGSITTRGLTIPAVLADVSTTGGLGTLATMAGAELSQAAPMTQFIAGASLPQQAAGQTAAATLRALLAEKRNQK